MAYIEQLFSQHYVRFKFNIDINIR